MKLKMRIISVFLCIAMVMTTLPVSSLTVKAAEGDTSVSDNQIVQVVDDIEDKVVADGDKAIVLDCDDVLYEKSGNSVDINFTLNNVDWKNIQAEITGNNGNTTCSLYAYSSYVCVDIDDYETSKELILTLSDKTDDNVSAQVVIKVNDGAEVYDLYFDGSSKDYFAVGQRNYISYGCVASGTNNVIVEISGNKSSNTKVDGLYAIEVADDENAEYIDVTLTAVADTSKTVTRRFYLVKQVDRVDIQYDEWFKLSPVYSHDQVIRELHVWDVASLPIRVNRLGLTNVSDESQLLYYWDETNAEWTAINASNDDLYLSNVDPSKKYAVKIAFQDMNLLIKDGDYASLPVYLNGSKIDAKVEKDTDYSWYGTVYYCMLPINVYTGKYIGQLYVYLDDYILSIGESTNLYTSYSYIFGDGFTYKTNYSVIGNTSDSTYVKSDDNGNKILYVGLDEKADSIIVRVASDEFPHLHRDVEIKVKQEKRTIDFFSIDFNRKEMYRGNYYYIGADIEGDASHKVNCDVELIGDNEHADDYYVNASYGGVWVQIGDNNKATSARLSFYPEADHTKKVNYEVEIRDFQKIAESEISITYDEAKIDYNADTRFYEYMSQLFDKNIGNISPQYDSEDKLQKFYFDYERSNSIVEYYEDEDEKRWKIVDDNDDVFDPNKKYGISLNIYSNTDDGYVFDYDTYRSIKYVVNGKSREDVFIWGIGGTNTALTEINIVIPILKPVSDHKHVGTLVKGKQSTCTEKGWSDYYSCTCGRFYEDEECRFIISDLEAWKTTGNGSLELANHDYSATYFADPQGHWVECSVCKARPHIEPHVSYGIESGLEDLICYECGYIITPNINHVHTPVPYVEMKDATCTENGVLASYTCLVCMHRFKDAEAKEEIMDVYSWDRMNSIIPAKGHKGGTATCLKKAVCEACNKEYGDLLPHTPVDMPAVEPTCTEMGKGVGSKCSVCGAILQQQPDIAAKGHIWDAGKVTKEPTLTEEGEKLFTCTVCKETKTEKIDKLPAPPKKDIEIPAKGKIDAAELLKDKIGNEKISRYVSSDKKIATVNKKGLVTGKKDGTVTITAQKKEGKKYYDVASVTITIKVPTLTKKVSIKYLDEKKDMMKELNNVPNNQPIVWSIPEKKKAIADIDGNGVITPKKNGTVKVTCTIGEGKAAVKYVSTVSVKTPVLSIKENISLKAGKTKAVTLKNVDKNANVIWTVSDNSKLEIVSGNNTSKIKIKANNPGTVELKAKIDGREFKSIITIE